MNVRIKCAPPKSSGGVDIYPGRQEVSVVVVADDGREVDISARVSKVTFIADAADEPVRATVEFVGPEIDLLLDAELKATPEEPSKASDTEPSPA